MLSIRTSCWAVPIVGFLVGLTGAGGGALMTPMLILLFNVKPTDGNLERPGGRRVHAPVRSGRPHLQAHRQLQAGRLDGRRFGANGLPRAPTCSISWAHAKTSQTHIEKALGAALLIGAAAMMRPLPAWTEGPERIGKGVVHGLAVRPLPTVVIGMVGGLIVGMTSVGSGSLMIVLLLFLYPMIGANQLVGTDLTQAVPLTAAAALGALAFGHVEFAVTTSIIIGSVPGVLVGSFLSSRAPDRYIRPAITFVIFASGLKYVGLGTTALGWVLCATLLAAAAVWLAYVRPWKNGVGPVTGGESLPSTVGPTPSE